MATCPALRPHGVVPTVPGEGARLAILGDVGRDTKAHRAVRQLVRERCAADPCDAVLLLGDNLYPAGPDGPDDPRLDEILGDYASIGAPVWMIAGNHDHGQDGSDPPVDAEIAWAKRRGIVFPATDYVGRIGDVSLVGVDTDRVFWGREPGPWLDRALADRSARWRVGFGHHPIRSQGPHGNAGAYEGHAFLPWFSGRSLGAFFDARICGAADVWLAGHDHTRQLLFGTPACPTTLIVSGAAATATEIVDHGNVAAFAEATTGYVELTLGDAAVATFLRDDGTIDGTFTWPAPRARPTR